MPKGKTEGGKWNFHVKRHICPACKRKGLTLAWNRKFYCMYKRFGCGKIFDYYNYEVRTINKIN